MPAKKRRKTKTRKSARRRRSSKKGKGNGRLTSILWVVGAVALAMVYVYIQNAGLVNKVSLAEKRIAPALKTAGISKRDLAAEKVEKRQADKKRYVHKAKVYTTRKDVSFKKLDESLKKDLKKSGFRVASSGEKSTRDGESYQAKINYGTVNVMDIKVVKPRVAAKPAPRPKPRPKPAPTPKLEPTPAPVPERPAVVKEPVRPRAKVAIVLDDFGYNTRNIPLLAEIDAPITLSVLPDLPYSRKVAADGRRQGNEIILHLPLESAREVPEEAHTIRNGMTASEIDARIAKDLRSVPGAVGVNNHQGSKATAEWPVMRPVLTSLKKRKLFFLDSVTSSNSVCRSVAAYVKIPFARRDVFLDNSNDQRDIEKQVLALKEIALKRGKAIAIGHDRKNTILVLKRMIPELEKEGVEVVPLSELVN